MMLLASRWLAEIRKSLNRNRMNLYASPHLNLLD